MITSTTLHPRNNDKPEGRLTANTAALDLGGGSSATIIVGQPKPAMVSYLRSLADVATELADRIEAR